MPSARSHTKKTTSSSSRISGPATPTCGGRSSHKWTRCGCSRSSRPSPPPVALGMHLATSPGRGSSAVPVRSAMAGTALAIAAVIATVTFAAGLGDLVSTPARFGRDWDIMIDGVFAPTPVARVLRDLGHDRSVEAIGGGRYGEVTIDGERIPTIGLTDLEGTTFPAIIDGRAPTRGDEWVMGKRSLHQIGRSLG